MNEYTNENNLPQVAILSRSVSFFQLLHAIPVGPIHQKKLPLEHFSIPVEDVGVNKAGMIHKDPLQTLHIYIPTLENHKEVFGSLFV